MLLKKSKSYHLVDLAMILIFQERKFPPRKQLKIKDPKQESIRSADKHLLSKQEVLELTVIISGFPFLVIKKSKGVVLVLK